MEQPRRLKDDRTKQGPHHALLLACLHQSIHVLLHAGRVLQGVQARCSVGGTAWPAPCDIQCQSVLSQGSVCGVPGGVRSLAAWVLAQTLALSASAMGSWEFSKCPIITALVRCSHIDAQWRFPAAHGTRLKGRGPACQHPSCNELLHTALAVLLGATAVAGLFLSTETDQPCTLLRHWTQARLCLRTHQARVAQGWMQAYSCLRVHARQGGAAAWARASEHIPGAAGEAHHRRFEGQRYLAWQEEGGTAAPPA